jgi:phospholipid/cholesterol/gamma-HCH transport system substrate-binding protein
MGRTAEAPLSRNSSVVGRLAALTAVAIAIVAVAIILLQGGTTYKVTAIFQNASQIVSGDLVQASGNTIGTVSDISLTPYGQAQLTLNITDSKYQPLRDGTIATVRQASLSGIANRYVDLRLGSAGRPNIKNGGLIGTDHTNSAVDLDQLFNTLDPSTRAALQDVIKGFASSYGGSGTLAQAGWQYLNPALASTSMLFREINRDTNRFTQFVVKTGHLVTDIAARRTDLSGLIVHLGATTSALASQNVALGQSIQRLPTFMRMANTTFVNLRNALDDLKPLIDDSKPVAPKLQRLLEQLRPLANDAVPTVRDLANIIRRPGPNNDLIELTNLSVPLAAVTVHNLRVNGTSRPGAFPQSVDALQRSTPELAVARPYAVDLTGWFDGYSHPGTIDANGSASRVAPVIGALSFQNGTYQALDPVLRLAYALNVLKFKQGDRCPGSMERGGVYYPESGYPCDPTQVPTGN